MTSEFICLHIQFKKKIKIGAEGEKLSSVMMNKK